MFKVLVVEDDAGLKNLFCRTLQRHNFEPFDADTEEMALDILDKEYIDLIVTDVMMPGMNGFEFIRQIREARIDIPVLIITAKSDILDKQIGFLSGSDDYMVKPIDINELILRAKSVHEKKLIFGATTLEYNTWTVTDDSGIQVLPQKEFMLLYKLLSYPGQIFTRQQISYDIWGINNYEDSHTLDVHISRLRDRFKNNKDFEISTIRGLGYRVVKRT